MKLITLLAALSFAGAASAQATDGRSASDVANQGIAADLGSTALGLSMGAAEANPLGALLIPLKFIVKAEIEKMPDETERRDAMATFSGAQFGAAAANICTLAAAAHPVIAVACFAGGAYYGYNKVKSIPTERECIDRNRVEMEAAAAAGRSYRVSLKTCAGEYVNEPLVAQAGTVEGGGGE